LLDTCGALYDVGLYTVLSLPCTDAESLRIQLWYRERYGTTFLVGDGCGGVERSLASKKLYKDFKANYIIIEERLER